MKHRPAGEKRRPASGGASPALAGSPARVVSVGTKLAGATILLMLIVTAVVYTRLSGYQREHLLQAKQMAAVAVTQLFADSCAAPIVFGDNAALNDGLARLGHGDEVPYAAVWSSDESGHASTQLAQVGTGAGVTLESIPALLELRRETDRLVLVAPVRDPDAKTVGVVVITFSLSRENQLIAQVLSNTLLASAAIAAGLTVLLLAIARFAIVRPLGKLVVAANQLEQGVSSDIDVRSRDELGQLAAAFRSMSQAITSREEHIRARNRDMRLVLDNVGQGFLTLDPNARVLEERSRVVHDWFGLPEANMPFWDYMGRVDAQAGVRFEIGWMQVVDNVMPLDLSLDQLPRLTRSAGRVLEFAYRPILKEGLLDQLLVVITDVSERIERERALLVQRETMSVFQHILSDRSAFEDFFDEAAALVMGIQSSDGSDRGTLLRLVHTLKGNCAIYGLEGIADFCHSLETELGASSLPMADERKRELGVLWARVHTMHAQFSTDTGISVPRDQYRALLEALATCAPASLVATLGSWQFEPASGRLALMGKQIQKLAQRMGKGDVQVSVAATDIRIPPKRWAPLWAVLSHVLRNTVDHGLDLPDERTEAGKASPPRVSLSMTRRDGELVLAIADDGRGINWVRIAERGRALGLPVETREELEAALFAQGVTSRTEVTTTSGRGVGLSAVLEVVSALGGRIRVHSELGRGTRFDFHLPESLLSEEPGPGQPGREGVTTARGMSVSSLGVPA